MTVPTAEENIVLCPLHSSRLVVRNWIHVRIWRQTTSLATWCPSSRGRSSRRHFLLCHLASVPPSRVSVHAATCWTPSEHTLPPQLPCRLLPQQGPHILNPALGLLLRGTDLTQFLPRKKTELKQKTHTHKTKLQYTL